MNFYPGFIPKSGGGYSGWDDYSSGNPRKNDVERAPYQDHGFSSRGRRGQSRWGDGDMGSQNIDIAERGNRRERPSAGMKRDAPVGDDDKKRLKQGDRWLQDKDEDVYGPRELKNWNDIVDHSEDASWYIEETKRLAEQFGNFVAVKPVKDHPERVEYYCELCFAVMNAKKSLEIHCTGMKHLKKKQIWEQNCKDGGGDTTKFTGVGRGQAGEPSSQHTPAAAPYRGDGRGDARDRGYPRPALDRDRGRYNDDPYDRRSLDRGGRDRKELLRSPYQDRRGETSHHSRRSPPPPPPPVALPIPKENLAGGTTGTLLKRLADCSVKTDADAQLAMDVISLLFNSLKEFHNSQGFKNAVLLVSEAEVKFNILKELHGPTPQARNSDSRTGGRDSVRGIGGSQPSTGIGGRDPSVGRYSNPEPKNYMYYAPTTKLEYSAPPYRYNP